MNIITQMRCPAHMELLTNGNSHEAKGFGSDLLICPKGCQFPFVDGIPRFVHSRNYANAFGKQWNLFRKTQLDSYTGTRISRERLERCLGRSVETLRGRDVLEAGCGAGRFTELLLIAGARVFACDLSEAVEANWENCRKYPNYFVCQADIGRLPISPEQFDVVICLGVIQHTPSPEETIKALCSHVKLGGLLVMDHYSKGYPLSSTRRVLRSFLLGRSRRFGMKFCHTMVQLLWPVHRILWVLRGLPGIVKARGLFLRVSPLVDYSESYSQLGTQLLREWAILDTHDTLTDVYKHLRSKEEIEDHLKRCGMVDVEVYYAGNGVEARARKPMEQKS
jgi:SAM-dependent methyltransferase